MDFILLNKEIFKNPLKVPLNELKLETKIMTKKKLSKEKTKGDKTADIHEKNYDVKVTKIPALDPHWIQKDHQFFPYQPYFSEVSPEENEDFLKKNEQFLESLTFLLKCTYHQFWCYIVYEPKVEVVLKSFVFNTTLIYDLKYMDSKYINLFNTINEKVAQVYSRMLTFEQSEVEYMSEKTVKKLLLKSNLLEFPMVMSLIHTFDKVNKNLVNRLANIYFTDNDAMLENNLLKLLNQFLLVMEMVGGEVCGYNEDVNKVSVGPGFKPKKFDPQWYLDVVLFLLDSASNFNAFSSVSKKCCHLAYNLGLPFRLTFFYSEVFPLIYKTIENAMNHKYCSYDWTDKEAKIYEYLALGRSEFVNCFHNIVSYYIDSILNMQGDSSKQYENSEKYIELISHSFEDELFIYDYHSTNNIDLQIQMITDFYPEIDPMRTKYILECLNTIPKPEIEIGAKQKKEEVLFPQIPNAEVASTSKACISAPEMSEDEIDFKIRSVMDTLPYLGDGYVLKCLQYYNFEPTDVISAILDENLPPQLAGLPPDLIRIPPEPAPPQPKLAYKGKKPTYKDTNQLLNDKSEIVQLKKSILKPNLMYDMYDDEYDDREDIDEASKVNAEEDPYKYMDNRFDGYELVSDPSETSDDEKEKPQESNKKLKNIGVKPVAFQNKRDFCEDPALLREKREAARKHHNRGADVVGKPKGEGQDKKVVNNRDKKNVNKSSRGNHSRKGGAQFKRNKGMIPS